MNSNYRHIVYIDLLGIRRNLLLGQNEYAEKKVLALTSVAEKVQEDYPDIIIRGSGDSIILFGTRSGIGWITAKAAVRIFREFYEFNVRECTNDISMAYLLRGGLAFGIINEISKYTNGISYSFILGDGISSAYETHFLGRGMRLFIQKGASRHFISSKREVEDGIYGIKIDSCYAQNGHIISSEIRWVGFHDEAEKLCSRASILFRKALTAFRRKEVNEEIVEHYKQTLCTILGGCSSPKSLLPFLTYRYKQTKYHSFLAPIWATAWLRLIRPKNSEFLLELRDVLWDKFLIISGTKSMGEVSTALHQKNRWRPLLRLLRKGTIRFGPRKR